MIKFIIEKNVDLKCKNNDGWKPIHLICEYSTPKMIEFIINKNVDLECEDNYGWKPIHFICKNSTPEMIEFIINKNVDLECKTNDGWKPIHFICRFSTPKIITYALTNFNTTEKIKKYNDTNVDYDVYDLIKLNPNVTDKTLFKNPNNNKTFT